jgi:hypothetical protein
MTTRISLSEPLADLCDRICAPCAWENTGDLCVCTPSDGCAEIPPLEIRKRWVNLPKPRCERYEFLLLIQAIEHVVPVEDQLDWLERPNIDLNGRRPQECIDACAYEPVFNALSLLDSTGPVS